MTTTVLAIVTAIVSLLAGAGLFMLGFRMGCRVTWNLSRGQAPFEPKPLERVNEVTE